MNTPGTGSSLGGFFAELRRRRVIRVAIVYAAVGWIIIEVASTVLPPLNVPDWSLKLVIVLIALGFPVAVIMAWMFDLGPRGVERAVSVPESGNDATARQLHSGSKPVPKPAVPALVDSDGRRSIAVLPFVNMSGDPENEYFSDGISEEILNLLTKLPQLKVASRTSSFFFKGKEINIPLVASELGVSTILEGSVRRAADRVRITAQLIDVESDSHLWSETYDREFKDVFAIQDDIAQSIVDALKVRLSPKERRAIQYVATSDPQAYDFYLRGRRYFHAMSRRDSHHAISMYEHAIELDPKYAAAWAGLADAYSELYRDADASPEIAAKAMEASAHAIELDPDSAEAQAARGFALSINNKHDEAEERFENAIRLNPNLFEAYLFYGRYCSSLGKFDKAVKLFAQASEVSPADYQPHTYSAMALSSLGRRDEEIEARHQVVRLIEQHLKVNPEDARARYLGAASLAVLKEKAKAIEWVNMALKSEPDEPNVLYNAACAFSQLGEHERALDLLEQAMRLGWDDRAWIETDSDLSPLHENPRFKALLAGIH